MASMMSKAVADLAFRAAILPATRPLTNAPPMMPLMVSTKNQKNCWGCNPRMLTQKHRCTQHIQKHAVERNAAGQRQQQEARVGAQLPIPGQQVFDMEVLAL